MPCCATRLAGTRYATRTMYPLTGAKAAAPARDLADSGNGTPGGRISVSVAAARQGASSAYPPPAAETPLPTASARARWEPRVVDQAASRQRAARLVCMSSVLMSFVSR